MPKREHVITRQVLALLAAAALVLTAAACGDESDSDSASGANSGSGSTALTTPTEPSSGDPAAPAQGGDTGADGDVSASDDSNAPSSSTAPASDEDEGSRKPSEADRAKAALTKIYKALRASDVSAVCDAMTPAAQRQLAASSPKKGQTCEQAFGRYYAFAERDSPKFRRALKGKVVSARVEGNRAVVAVRFPRKSALSPVLLVKDGGTWKLPGVPAAKGD